MFDTDDTIVALATPPGRGTQNPGILDRGGEVLKKLNPF